MKVGVASFLYIAFSFSSSLKSKHFQVLYIQWLCCVPATVSFTNKDREDEDGPSLKPATLYQGSPNKLCTSVSCPTNNYFLMGLVLPLMS